MPASACPNRKLYPAISTMRFTEDRRCGDPLNPMN
jgi:hypothetical protein